MQRSGADSTSRVVKSASRPRFVETVGAGASVRVLRLMSQVACRPLGASVFDAHTFVLPEAKGNAPNADGLDGRL